MKQFASRLIVMLLMVSMLIPSVVPQTASHPLTVIETSALSGGKPPVDCEALAAGAYALCVTLGGGWIVCGLASAGAYLGCIAGNSLANG